ncbi:MAG TPA: hypothetical protein VL484_02420 [Vicinamibacterales bacterium]|nr:hypothetical protein [Vicinamibacterales bacterium]
MTRTVLVCLFAAFLQSAPADIGDAQYFGNMRWRSIGPNRAGRAWVVAGVPDDPSVYYMGTPAGALWKSTSGGTTWHAISDALPVTGIGAVAIAASNPNVVYVGTGSNTLGAGVFRSDDAGATWSSAGLTDTKYIVGLLVDPHNADLILAAAGGGGNFGSMVFYNNGPSPGRGVYRSADGGHTWAHALTIDPSSAIVDLVWDPSAPGTVFASATGRPGSDPPAIFVSHDEGTTWTRLPGDGLPRSVGTLDIAVAPNSSGRRLYALSRGQSGGGLYRSDDGGSSWTLGTDRLASAGGHLYVDPHDQNVVYTMGTSVYRSTDGGRTLEAIKGAPGGDDPHAMWIDPQNPRRMIVGADQGPTISIDGGATWSPWYVVPNGELYFVSTDQGFPYRIYAAQQDSGTVSILSRSDYGAIRPNDWNSVSGYEQGHIFDDPLNPRFVYSHGDGHRVIRFDRETGQVVPAYTPTAEDRFGPRPGMDLSAKDPHWMFVGAQYVLASSDRVTWTRISPDLTVRNDAQATGRQPAGTIVALAASPLDLDVLWAATSNGLVHVTRDRGRTWKNVSPPIFSSNSALTTWSMEASPHDPSIAYAAAIDLSDRHGPCLLMTSDYGATWREIVNGLPADVPTRVVREDPRVPSLLYAGTQAGAYVSFDRGARWTPLQLNLPRITVNDITVHGNDLVIATWGRGLWILDDVTPLRQIEQVRAGETPVFLFNPAPATRVRWDNNHDTPLPPEILSGENAPDGAVIDYYLKSAVSRVSISIQDEKGHVVREFTNAVPAADSRMPNVPEYWFAPPAVAAANPGMHRLVWDLRYPSPPPLDFDRDGRPSTSVSYGIIAPAVRGASPRQQPLGPLVLPGTYRMTIAADGASASRMLTVRNDPRSTASAADLATQLDAERGLTAAINRVHDAVHSLRALLDDVQRRTSASQASDVSSARDAFNRNAAAAITALAGGRSAVDELSEVDQGDAAPTPSTAAAIAASCAQAATALASYRRVIGEDLTALNRALSGAGVAPLAATDAAPAGACEVK